MFTLSRNVVIAICVVAILGVLACCGLSALAYSQGFICTTSPCGGVVAEPTQYVAQPPTGGQPTVAPIVPLPEIPGGEQPQPGPSCQPMAAGETRSLQPGQTILGDVEVEGTVRYDIGGSDEGTIVVNLSSKTVEVFAEWGAGCLTTTDLNRLVTNEYMNTGCGPSRPCARVRAVLITDQGITETFYNAPLAP